MFSPGRSRCKLDMTGRAVHRAPRRGSAARAAAMMEDSGGMDQCWEAPEQEQRPVFYGDTRVTTDRRKGSCLFWVCTAPCKSHSTRVFSSSPCARTCTCAQVVPDVAPGFNVPNFYDDFIRERRAFVQEKIENRRQLISAQTMPPHPRPLNTSVPIG